MTYREQFDQALACETKEQADKWLAGEIARYGREFGQSAEESRRVILVNLGLHGRILRPRYRQENQPVIRRYPSCVRRQRLPRNRDA